jgi:nucleoside-diphosphate-sugar epimerase
MRIYLTGGAGLIGRAVAERLIDGGHAVHMIDTASSTDAPHTTYAACDITDYDAVHTHMRGCDAVVHMAALRNAMHDPGHEVFRVNVTGTFNVFEAAAKHGLRRVVQASSINALGCAWALGDFVPRYLPVDEQHPLNTTDPYSFSKQQIEAIGDYYWRREGMTSAALRFPGIYPADKQHDPQVTEGKRAMREFLDEFAALPQAERDRQLAIVRAAVLQARAARVLEYPNGRWNIEPVEGIDPRLTHAYMFDRFNLWASMDVRDAALAVEQALLADYEGSHAVFVNNPHNALRYNSETLARLFFPAVTERRSPLAGSQALISTERARQLFGFETRHNPDEGTTNVETR